MTERCILDLAMSVLEDMKAIDVLAIDVRELTSISDHMIFCTGTSNRHARSIIDRTVEKMKEISMNKTMSDNNPTFFIIDVSVRRKHHLIF